MSACMSVLCAVVFDEVSAKTLHPFSILLPLGIVCTVTVICNALKHHCCQFHEWRVQLIPKCQKNSQGRKRSQTDVRANCRSVSDPSSRTDRGTFATLEKVEQGVLWTTEKEEDETFAWRGIL